MKKLLGNNTKGVIAYGDNVLFSIIQLATLEISGVDSLVGKGVKMNIAAGIVNVSVTIKVRADVSCADVAFRVQTTLSVLWRRLRILRRVPLTLIFSALNLRNIRT